MNSDEYPQGKILKSALVNCLRRSNDEVNTGNKWDLQNIPQKATKQIAQNEASALLPRSSRSWSCKSIANEIGCFWFFVNPLDE